ncbi:interleukin-21 receptor isoform X2 [Micropterus salmoides]|uniref:interleukin-21 receptor isoform X2 n=1 Tax=Micropterus salmoides TaxID=27706 RepID=UPI0018ED45B7|nr:interleukin-21 receptor isoform X2 [Micropterus salmoides]
MTSVRHLRTDAMSGPSGVMECRFPPRLLITFLLVSTNTACLYGHLTTGVDPILHCVNDYLFTINCSLSVAGNTSDSNSSYWLTFIKTTEKKKFVCMLTNTNGDYFCSVKTSESMPDDYAVTFDDTVTFEISLCHNKSNGSESLKPNAPCCLTISHNSNQHHFTWKSTYENYTFFTDLISDLKYQLHYYKRGDKHNVVSHDINTDSTNYSVDDYEFVPDTEYAARVRSSPNEAFYMGEWSDWSSEVHWKTESAENDLQPHTFVSGLGKVFIALCVMVPFVLLLCYAPVKKWRQSAFIPTPAPYFHTLYSDCQGDFKSWVVTQENTADMMKAEETLQIDTLAECADLQEEACPHFHHQLMEASTYCNIASPGCSTSLLGIPYAVSTMTPLPDLEGSGMSLTFSSQPGSPAEGDSGCWLCSHTSLEKDPPWSCKEYCTLSTFQQTSPVKAEHHGSSSKSCPTGIIRVDAITEA